MSICVSHRRSYISITASFPVTAFAKRMLILSSQNNWWRHPAVLLLTQAPAFSHSLMVSHMHTKVYKHTHTHTQKKQKAQLFSISRFQAPKHNLNCSLAYVETTEYLFLQTCTQTCSFRHANVPMCSLTLTWVGSPAVQAVSSINMCLLAGDPYVCITGRQ